MSTRGRRRGSWEWIVLIASTKYINYNTLKSIIKWHIQFSRSEPLRTGNFTRIVWAAFKFSRNNRNSSEQTFFASVASTNNSGIWIITPKQFCVSYLEKWSCLDSSKKWLIVDLGCLDMQAPWLRSHLIGGTCKWLIDVHLHLQIGIYWFANDPIVTFNNVAVSSGI